MTGTIFDELKWRGLIYDHTEGVEHLLATQKVHLYNGFDATANSLHIGHLVPLIALRRFQLFGHFPIALAGGGTSMIGDPSGKTSERQLLSKELIEENILSIKRQLAHFLDFDAKTNPARLLNNADWLTRLNLIDFLRDIGKYFTINYMITKDSVKTRIDREEGISFTEFSYMLLQSYDFLHLYKDENCVIQTGGSDQWGNITAGAELIRRVTGNSAGALVYPLITKADGTKFGKTESGSVWLDPQRTSPYRFFQFWLNTDDRDVIKYLKLFTFLTKDQVDELENKLIEHPEQREAQRCLAVEMTNLVHGPSAVDQVLKASQVLFGGEISGLSEGDIEEIFADVPSSSLSRQLLSGTGIPVVDLLTSTGLMKSKSDARRSISEGGVYLNNNRVDGNLENVTLEQLILGRFLVLRKGRKNYHLVRIE